MLLHKDKLSKYLNDPKFNFKLSNTKDFYFKSPVCGDFNTLYVDMDLNGIVKEISYQNSSCSLNIGVLELFCDFIKDKHYSEYKKFDIDYLSKKLSFPQNKVHCIDLALKTISLAFATYKED